MLTGPGFLALAAAHGTITAFVAGTCLAGVGFGLLLAGLPVLVTAAAPVDVAGGAAGVYNTVRGLGGALVGGLFAGVVGSAVISRGLLPAEHAYETAWTLCGVFGLAVAALAAIIRTADDTAGDPGGRPLTPAVPSPVCP